MTRFVPLFRKFDKGMLNLFKIMSSKFRSSINDFETCVDQLGQFFWCNTTNMQFNIWFKFDVSFFFSPQKTLETVPLERKKVLCQQVTSYLRI